MAVKITEGERTVTGGDGIEVTANKVVNLLLREEDNLIKIDGNNEVYADLQLEDGLSTSDDLPVGVTTGRVLQADGWLVSGTMLCFKTTSGDYVTRIYGDDGKLYIDNGTGTFKQIYLKSEVDALFTQLRGEISAVGYSGEYADLLHKPVLGTAASKDVGTNAGNVPVLDSNGKLDSNIVPSTGVMTSYTVTNKSDLTTLTTAKKGDIGIVTSENKTYILSEDPYSDINNWTELLFPTGSVSSVNGFTGAVNLTTGYIQESNNKLFVSPTEKATWNNKLGANNVSTVALTGNYSDLNNKPIVDSTLNTTSTNAIQNSTIATTVNNINNTISGMQSDISDLQTASGGASQDISDIKSSIVTIQGDISSIDGDITNIQGDISALQTAVGGGISDTAYGSSWNGDTTHAPTKNAVYDKIESMNLVPTGGTEGQILTKTSDGYGWANNDGGLTAEEIAELKNIILSGNINTFSGWITFCSATGTEHTGNITSIGTYGYYNYTYTVQGYGYLDYAIGYNGATNHFANRSYLTVNGRTVCNPQAFGGSAYITDGGYTFIQPGDVIDWETLDRIGYVNIHERY